VKLLKVKSLLEKLYLLRQLRDSGNAEIVDLQLPRGQGSRRQNKTSLFQTLKIEDIEQSSLY